MSNSKEAELKFMDAAMLLAMTLNQYNSAHQIMTRIPGAFRGRAPTIQNDIDNMRSVVQAMPDGPEKTERERALKHSEDILAALLLVAGPADFDKIQAALDLQTSFTEETKKP